MARHPINPGFELIAQAATKMSLYEEAQGAYAFTLVCSINMLTQEILDSHCGRGHETTYETLCEMVQKDIEKCEKHIKDKCKKVSGVSNEKDPVTF